VSRILRRLCFWILVRDTRRPSGKTGLPAGVSSQGPRPARGAQVAHDLDISEQSIYTWRRQDRVDKDLVPGGLDGLGRGRGGRVAGGDL